MRSALNKLPDADFILLSACSQRAGHQVFRRHDPCWNAVHIRFDSLDKGFFVQGIAGWQKLHRPAANDDVFFFHAATVRYQVILDGRKRNQYAAGSQLE